MAAEHLLTKTHRNKGASLLARNSLGWGGPRFISIAREAIQACAPHRPDQGLRSLPHFCFWYVSNVHIFRFDAPRIVTAALLCLPDWTELYLDEYPDPVWARARRARDFFTALVDHILGRIRNEVDEKLRRWHPEQIGKWSQAIVLRPRSPGLPA